MMDRMKRNKKLSAMAVALILCALTACGKPAAANMSEGTSENGTPKSVTDTPRKPETQKSETGTPSDVKTVDGILQERVEYDNTPRTFWLLPDGKTESLDAVSCQLPDGFDKDKDLLYGDHIRVSYTEIPDSQKYEVADIEALEPVYEIKVAEGRLLSRLSDAITILTDEEELEIVTRNAKVIIRNSESAGQEPDTNLLNYGERIKVEYIVYSPEEAERRWTTYEARVVEELYDYSLIQEVSATVVGLPEDSINLELTTDDGTPLIIQNIFSKSFNDYVTVEGVTGSIDREGLKLKVEYRGELWVENGVAYLKGEQVTRITGTE